MYFTLNASTIEPCILDIVRNLLCFDVGFSQCRNQFLLFKAIAYKIRKCFLVLSSVFLFVFDTDIVLLGDCVLLLSSLSSSRDRKIFKRQASAFVAQASRRLKKMRIAKIISIIIIFVYLLLQSKVGKSNIDRFCI